MGNCYGCDCDSSPSEYFAKETYHPYDEAFDDPTAPDDDSERARMAELIRRERPLKMDMNDKLRMLNDDTGLIAPDGTELYRMENLGTHETGLVPIDLVALAGTVEAEM